MRSFIKSNGVLAGVLSLFLIIFIVAGACLCIELFVDDTNNAGAETTFGDEQITVDGKDYNLKSDVSTFLVMGLDKYSVSWQYIVEGANSRHNILCYNPVTVHFYLIESKGFRL